ncbi:NUMOD4 domain-containing protein [Cupriavidus metallidurans]|uniref:NUMOD4 domain-containing protein n=1 Tax=Cupriavidus metallidurans TaxID=119219 RepID=UPI000CE05BE5|nr:NUMOD4 domain-containing protein [Cupriavidus metallidurans]AVA33338.1 hypothetical protein C3Z06_06660 [Cupriavidus metallidurans]
MLELDTDDTLRDIPGYEGRYAVTADGRVWSHTKSMRGSHGSTRSRAGAWMRIHLSSTGYPTVRLYVTAGQSKLFGVHRLVAMAWVANDDPANKVHVNHINGIKNDPKANNLEWCSVAENNLHAYATGLRRKSEKEKANASQMGRACRKLTAAQVELIRQGRNAGVPVNDLASAYGVSRQAISAICNGRTYLNP